MLSMKHPDLHPLFDSQRSSIEFWVAFPYSSAYVVLPLSTLAARYALPEGDYGMLRCYESHRTDIDAAVMRCAATQSGGTFVMQPEDLPVARTPATALCGTEAPF